MLSLPIFSKGHRIAMCIYVHVHVQTESNKQANKLIMQIIQRKIPASHGLRVASIISANKFEFLNHINSITPSHVIQSHINIDIKKRT